MRAMSITHHQYMVLAAAEEDAGPEERGIQAESGDDQEVVKWNGALADRACMKTFGGGLTASEGRRRPWGHGGKKTG